MSRQERVVVRISGLAALLLALGSQVGTAQDAEGKVLYDRWCAGCHGETGAGDGEAAAWMLPRPRDFGRAVYQIRTTASGELPTDQDLARVIDNGMPGSSMPGWKAKLNSGQRDQIITHLKSFSRFFADAPPAPIDFGRPPASTPEGIAEGQQVYRDLECFKCHGDQGRGDGPSAPTMTDDWDFPIRPADLSEYWYFNGGGTVEDIYRRLRTGLDGTPMPSFSDVIESGIITEAQLWRVAQYVRSLGPESPPKVREVIRARLVAGPLPAGPDDSTWAGVEAFYVPLVGQIIRRPRNFSPAVDGLWAQAVHDGERLALRLRWHDPSSSPDSAWQDWLHLLGSTLTDADGPLPAAQGPDRVHVQLPLAIPDGLERPYFLGGDAKRPVEVWRWTSRPDRVTTGIGTGLDAFRPSPAPAVEHAARFDAGEWRVQFTRPLVAQDSAGALTFVAGRTIPVAFLAADGSSGEGEMRAAVSAWYGIYLDVPTPARAFVTPVLAVILTAAFGLTLVKRAQHRHHAGVDPIGKDAL